MAATTEPDTIVWITGATSGIGEALARTVPYRGAKLINISRRLHANLPTVQADLADPAGWDTVESHLAAELAGFTGRRAIFVHNAFLNEPMGFVGEVDPIEYRRHVLANAAAPLVLGEAFLRHLPAGVEGGLVMISSAAARVPFAGRAGYGAGKAAMEQWVRAVRSELAHRGSPTWVVAIRPGAVDTPSMRSYVEVDARDNPTATAAKAAIESGEMDSAELAAARIWAAVPPAADSPAVVLLGEMIAPPRAPAT
ncbi:MAG: SDR family NAD(P)-dependent oxidoreductase [Actinomycetota bacterium]|nr:SDR family NAD(P)-dependent oxidoreductase [Actinomycetota bacterium]